MDLPRVLTNFFKVIQYIIKYYKGLTYKIKYQKGLDMGSVIYELELSLVQGSLDTIEFKMEKIVK